MATAMSKEVEKLNVSGEIPQDKLLGIGKLYKELDDKEILQHAYKVGERLPDFCLPNANGDQVDLVDLRQRQSQNGGGPIVITFFRGDWCPYCHTSVNILNDHVQQFQELGATVVAISPQNVSSCAKMQRNLLSSGGEATTTAATDTDEDGIYSNVLTLLSDTNCEYAQDCNIALCLDDPLLQDVNFMVPEYNRDEGFTATKDDGCNEESCWFVPVPATYVIDSKGIILYRFLDTVIWKRVEPYSIMEVLRKQRRDQLRTMHDDLVSSSSSTTSSVGGVDQPPRKPQSPSSRRKGNTEDAMDGHFKSSNRPVPVTTTTAITTTENKTRIHHQEILCSNNNKNIHHYKPKRRAKGIYSLRRKSFVRYHQCSLPSTAATSSSSSSTTSSKSLLSILQEPLPVLDEECQPNTETNRAA